MTKFLITGCGRSGTGFYSKLLNDNGISCGHESYIDYRGIKCQNFIAESSWLAIPYLDLLDKNSSILRTLRNPLLVIKSFYELAVLNEKFSHSPYQQFIYKQLPHISKYDEITRIALYYRDWNKLFDEKSGIFNHRTYIFEEVLTNGVVDFFGKIFQNPKMIVNQKKKKKKRHIELDQIDSQLPNNLNDEILNYYYERNKWDE